MPIYNKKIHGGVKIPKYKYFTKDSKVEKSMPPKLLYFPMSMHIGKPAEKKVDVGDYVKRGSLLGSGEEGVTANVHSSISGKVVEIKELNSFRGKAETIVIENDFKDEEEFLDKLDKDITPEDFAQRLRDAGITGKGGAGFPTAVKYQEDKDKIKYLVVNGAECEPYSTTDLRVMIEHSDEVVEAMELIMKVYEVQEGHIAIEKSGEEGISSLEKSIKDRNIDNIFVHLLPDEYPQGHSGLQIRDVLGIEIEEDQRSGDVGILQSNVSTIKAIYESVFLGKPFFERIITITGQKIKNPKNLLVRVGTPVKHLIEECGGIEDSDNVEMINGGPMMGKSFEDENFPADKDTTTLLFIEKNEIKEESDCIRCAKCIEVCPVALQPILISNAYKSNRPDQVLPLRSQSCISCGSCTYICPANIPLLENIQKLNKEWEEIIDDES